MPYQSASVKGFSDFAPFWVWSVCMCVDTVGTTATLRHSAPLDPQTGTE